MSTPEAKRGPYKVQPYKLRFVRDGRAITLPGGARAAMHCQDDVVALYRPILAALPHEEVHVCFLDGCNAIRGVARVSQGGIHDTQLRPSDLLRLVLLSGEPAFVMAHNHPSGDPEPSAADVETTRQIGKAASLMGVHFLDHVVIARGGEFVSMREKYGDRLFEGGGS